MIPRMYTHVIGGNSDIAIAKQDVNDGFALAMNYTTTLHLLSKQETVFRNIAFY
jgi:hypothetical protein